MRCRKGATLVELMLAGAILALVVTSLFEGVLVANRIAHENAELLAAQAIASDAAWWRFNEKYDGKSGLDINIPKDGEDGWENLSRTAAPLLSRYPLAPQLRIEVSAIAEAGWDAEIRVITADVRWGPEIKDENGKTRRRKLSDSGHEVRVCRGTFGRVP